MFTDQIAKLLIYYGVGKDISIWLALLSVLSTLLFVALLSDFIARRYFANLLGKLLIKARPEWGDSIRKYDTIKKLAHIVPAVLIFAVLDSVTTKQLPISQSIGEGIQKLLVCYLIVVLVSVINATLNAALDIYRKYDVSTRRPMRSYVQLLKLIIYAIATIFIVAFLLDKSPLAILAGIGTLTAIIMLVFKDSILGLVASIQLTINDMVRIGDWIDMPSYGASGDVIEISLSTVKVRNFDKTISTIPTYSLLTSGVKNWRGMKESGGRRIKRSIYIDMNTIKFCNDDMIERFKDMRYISDYIQSKIDEISEENKKVNGGRKHLHANLRALTNIGVFRQYIENYLKDHPKVNKSFTFLIRQLQPTETGLPIELYLFTNDTNWILYEKIQADIFDHLLAVLVEFELCVFQNTSGQNLIVELIQPQQA